MRISTALIRFWQTEGVSDEKKPARLNLIGCLLKHIPYEDLKREKVKLPDRHTSGMSVASALAFISAVSSGMMALTGNAVLQYLEHLNRGVGRSTFDDQDQAVTLLEDRQGFGLSRQHWEPRPPPTSAPTLRPAVPARP
jgi:hypothetical protein